MRGLREIGLAPPAVLRCAQLLCRTTEDILVCQYAARTTAKPQIDGFQVRRRMSACCTLQCFFSPSRPNLHTCTALVAGCCLKRKQQRMARAAWMLVRGFRITGVTGMRGRLLGKWQVFSKFVTYLCGRDCSSSDPGLPGNWVTPEAPSAAIDVQFSGPGAYALASRSCCAGRQNHEQARASSCIRGLERWRAVGEMVRAHLDIVNNAFSVWFLSFLCTQVFFKTATKSRA